MSKQVESAVNQSRGEGISNYLPPFKKGAQALSANIGALWLSGTIVSGQTTRAILHGIGRKPKHVSVKAILTLAEAISAKVPTVSLAAASAATSANFYVISNKASNAAIKYEAYLQW
jgi:hypothetical protein